MDAGPGETAIGEAAIRALEADLAELCGQLNVLNARLTATVAEALEHGLWAQWGIHTPAHWLAWQTGLSPHHAREVVRVARARVKFPAVTAAFDAGELALDQVATAVKAPPSIDAELCELAKLTTVHQLSKVVRRYHVNHNPHPEDVPEPVVVHESCSSWFDDTGRYHLNAELDPDRGRLLDAALTETRDRLFHNTPVDQRRHITNADALVTLAEQSLDAAPRGRRERFRINIHLDPAHDTTTWADGHHVPDWISDLLLCDGTINPVIIDNAIPVSVGRTQRIVADRTRRLVEHRDLGCRVPGCDRHRLVQIHHIIHDTDAGPTDTWNLVCLCPLHHRLHHQHKLGITGNADLPHGLTFTDQHGRPLPGSGTPRAPTRPPPTPQHPYQHPLGERLHHHAINFTNTPAAA